MKDKIRLAFPACDENGCLETESGAEFRIRDLPGGKSIIVRNPEEECHFTVFNPMSLS